MKFKLLYTLLSIFVHLGTDNAKTSDISVKFEQNIIIMENVKQTFESLCKEYKPEYLSQWKLKPSGDMILDFFHLTDRQGAGKSYDPNDTASKYPPPLPDVDNRYPHTNRDVTWQTYEAVMKKNGIVPTPEKFYNLTDKEKYLCVKDFCTPKKSTGSHVIDILIAGFKWGGNAPKTVKRFTEKYGNLFEFIQKHGEQKTFDLLCLERIYFLWELNPKYKIGWTRSVLCFWKLFRTYAKQLPECFEQGNYPT